LSPEQKQALRRHAKAFAQWLKTEEGQDQVEEHREHERFFKEKLSPESIDKLTEEKFAEVYKELWASQLWSNKDWYVRNKLIGPNGFDNLRAELKKLLYGKGDPAKRFDDFRENISGFGTSSISEILHMVFPDQFCLWNEKPKTVLPFLGLHILPEKFFKYQIEEGKDYMQCVAALQSVKEELAEFGVRDFIDLDLFFWHIFSDVMPKTVTEKEKVVKGPAPKIKIDSHEGGEYYLLELGKMLGYLPYTVDQSKTFEGKRLGDAALLSQIPPFASERDMIPAKEIDVIWFNEDENPEYCFEVEHTTDIVHGLDRLIQLQHLYVKKFVIVAPEERRSKFESLLQRVHYRRIRDRLRFISYDELASLHEKAVPFHELKVQLLGER